MDQRLIFGLSVSFLFGFARWALPTVPRWVWGTGITFGFGFLIWSLMPSVSAQTFGPWLIVVAAGVGIALWVHERINRREPLPPNAEVSHKAMAKMLHCSSLKIYGDPDLSNGLSFVFRIFNGTSDAIVIDRMRGVIWGGPDEEGGDIKRLPEPAWTNRPVDNPGGLLPVVIQQSIPPDFAADWAARLAAGGGIRFVLTRMDFYASSKVDRNRSARLSLWHSADIKLVNGSLMTFEARGENIPPNDWNVEV